MVKVFQVIESGRWILVTFMTDQVEKGNLKIKYCPTDDTWEDFLTMPTQGKHVRSFKNYVLGGNE